MSNSKAQKSEARRGVGAAPGECTGTLVFQRALVSEPYIYVCVSGELDEQETAHVRAAAGVVLLRGGMTADAAIVARGAGIPCVISVQGFYMTAAGPTLDGSPCSTKATLSGSRGELVFS
jgi:phosphoenolpyruvate synthase/pyruvate phosphate dikinase